MVARSVPAVLQGMNKLSTACQLRFDLRCSSAFTPEAKLRLAWLAGSKMTDDGWLVIEAKRYRTQEQNRLGALIGKALVKPKTRKEVVIRAGAGRGGPGRARGKIHRSKVKRLCRGGDDWD
jgi:ribosome-associated protein